MEHRLLSVLVVSHERIEDCGAFSSPSQHLPLNGDISRPTALSVGSSVSVVTKKDGQPEKLVVTKKAGT